MLSKNWTESQRKGNITQQLAVSPVAGDVKPLAEGSLISEPALRRLSSQPKTRKVARPRSFAGARVSPKTVQPSAATVQPQSALIVNDMYIKIFGVDMQEHVVVKSSPPRTTQPVVNKQELEDFPVVICDTPSELSELQRSNSVDGRHDLGIMTDIPEIDLLSDVQQLDEPNNVKNGELSVTESGGELNASAKTDRDQVLYDDGQTVSNSQGKTENESQVAIEILVTKPEAEAEHQNNQKQEESPRRKPHSVHDLRMTSNETW